MSVVEESEIVPELASYGIRAFTTTRASGSFGLGSQDPVADVMRRWSRLREDLRPATRLATASQVHGSTVLVHHAGWNGWLRSDAADGHLTVERGTALAVTVQMTLPNPWVAK